MPLLRKCWNASHLPHFTVQNDFAGELIFTPVSIRICQWRFDTVPVCSTWNDNRVSHEASTRQGTRGEWQRELGADAKGRKIASLIPRVRHAAEHVYRCKSRRIHPHRAYRWACATGTGNLAKSFGLRIFSVGIKILRRRASEMWVHLINMMNGDVSLER